MLIFSFYIKKDLTHILFQFLPSNLMKRAENCADAKINHIFFKHYSLVFQFSKSKGHQNGENHVGPWNMYSNPHETHLCAYLSLDRVFLIYPELLVE